MTETIPAEVIEAMLRKWYCTEYVKNPRTVIEPSDMADMRAALKAAEAAGYVLAPVEATVAMINGGLNSSRDADHDLYRAMIAARPKVP